MVHCFKMDLMLVIMKPLRDYILKTAFHFYFAPFSDCLHNAKELKLTLITIIDFQS